MLHDRTLAYVNMDKPSVNNFFMQLALIVIVATILWSSLPKSEGAQKKRASPIVKSGRDSILIHIKMCQIRIGNSPIPRAPAQPGVRQSAAVRGHCKHRAAR